MKRYILNIVWGVLLACLFTACAEDELVNNTTRKSIVEGIPVQVKMSFNQDVLEKVSTRASLADADENKVDNIYLFIFNNSSKKLEACPSFEIKDEVSKQLTFNITSGEKIVYALANVNTVGISKISTEDLASVGSVGSTTIADFMKLTAKLDNESVMRISGSLLMSGAFVANTGNFPEGFCAIDVDASVTPGVVKLSHIDSKIKFEVSTIEDQDSIFVPKQWRVVNVPAQTSVVEMDNGMCNSYFNTEWATFEDPKMDATNTKYKGGSFVFYMYENRKEAINDRSGQEIQSYADREAEYKNTNGTNSTEYRFVEKNATYVELTGSFYSYVNGTIRTSSDVRYVIHLGGGASDFKNFKSLRNKDYTYRVQIKGVENIVVEVQSGEEGKEPRPGAEGDVVRTTQNLSLDSHYETRVVTFYKNKLSNLSVLVKTPYSQSQAYRINANDGTVADDLTDDFTWVEFLKNKNNIQSFETYPGTRQACEKNGKAACKNIKELLQELYDYTYGEKKNKAGFWSEGNDGYYVRYTVFVNEFYYEDKDALWSEYVNVPNREMHILCNTEYSKDKESSLTTSSILINQRSVKSFYKGDTSTAWGIESVGESDNIPLSAGKTEDILKSTLTNGRFNMLELMGINAGSTRLKSWDSFVKQEDNTLESDGKTAYWTCLQRNRDLNGNGKIDLDEVRWYLPATNQYVGLWLGRDALPVEARIFQGNPSVVNTVNRFDFHFLSSNIKRIWSEEGISTGNNYLGNTYKVRCARNLGGYYTGLAAVDKEPVDYVKTGTKQVDNMSCKFINLTNVNPAALRRNIAQALTSHKEHTGGESNRPYAAFVIANEDIINDAAPLSVNSVAAWNTNCVNKFGDGWRVPNQRELALMVYYYPHLFKNAIGACTTTDLAKYKSDKIYRYLQSKSLIDLDVESVNAVRCVKDVNP